MDLFVTTPYTIVNLILTSFRKVQFRMILNKISRFFFNPNTSFLQVFLLPDKKVNNCTLIYSYVEENCAANMAEKPAVAKGAHAMYESLTLLFSDLSIQFSLGTGPNAYPGRN